VVAGIDHLVILVEALEAAVAGYEELGFRVTPGGEHADGLVEVAVGGGLGDPQALPDQRYVTALPEPHQREHGLIGAAQRPAAGPGATVDPLGAQQGGEELRQFGGHVEHGRIGDHVEPFG